MQQSIFGVGVRVFNSTRLFFPQANGLPGKSAIQKVTRKNISENILNVVYVLSCTLIMILAQPLWAEEPVSAESPVAKEITAIIATKHHPFLMQANFTNRADDLDALYKMANYQLLWLGHDHSQKNITEALDLLENASVNGLDSKNYDALLLRHKLWPALKFGP
ncbi:MAG: L,D-transpeptidase scaffold domain-containing protein, partial [Methylobacter sp.]